MKLQMKIQAGKGHCQILLQKHSFTIILCRFKFKKVIVGYIKCHLITYDLIWVA